MRNLTILLMISLMPAAFAHVGLSDPVAAGAADAQVVVHINDLDDAMLARLATQVSKDRNATLE